MGQPIEVAEPVILEDVAVFDTDRSFSGQDGEGFSSLEDSAANPGFPSQLAKHLFEFDSSISNVYVFSNTVSVRREGGWEDGEVAAGAAALLRDFFVVYEENRG